MVDYLIKLIKTWVFLYPSIFGCYIGVIGFLDEIPILYLGFFSIWASAYLLVRPPFDESWILVV